MDGLQLVEQMLHKPDQEGNEYMIVLHKIHHDIIPYSNIINWLALKISEIRAFKW